MEIHHGHLEFKLKITDVAQSANDGCRPCSSGVVHHETRKLADLYVVNMLDRIPDQFQPCFNRKKRCFFCIDRYHKFQFIK